MPWIGALWRWLDERTNISTILQKLLRHPVPASLTTRVGWFYVFGFSLLIVFMMQVLTGIGLVTVYVPSPASAHESVRFITESATFGRLLRGTHYIGASAMVILVLIHATRVFLMGSHKFPRELNWMTGVVLIGLVIVMVFTGQLLRWDVNSIASVNVAVEQLGRIPLLGSPLARFILAGETIGGATLTRFFVLHVFIMPLLMALLIGLHLYLVLHNGVSEPPRTGAPVEPSEYRKHYRALLERGRPYFPYMVWREALFAAVVVGLIILLAYLLGPRELGTAPDPTVTDVEPRPDWYLLWLYALFSIIGSRLLEDFVIVLGPVLLFIAFMLIPLIGSRGERSPRVRPLAILGVMAVFISLGSLTYAGVKAPWKPRFHTEPINARGLGINDPLAIDGARIFFERGCQYCHAIRGEGGSRGRDLTDAASRLRESVLIARIMVPPDGMPSYADTLSPEEIERLVAFLRSIADLE